VTGLFQGGLVELFARQDDLWRHRSDLRPSQSFLTEAKEAVFVGTKGGSYFASVADH
jgi:hypothetical protein